MNKLSFSGHDTFICKQPWLKKGYDFIINDYSFSDENAVVHLGVGKNMVSAIRYWLKSFGLIDEKDEPTKFANHVFGKSGIDPYLEDIGTIWLLHYHLIKTRKASIYNLIFNEFKRERFDVQKEVLFRFLKRKCDEENLKISYNKTLTADINVFIKNYSNDESRNNGLYEEMSGILIELNLLKYDKQRETVSFNINHKEDIPKEIILFAILDNENYGSSITVRELMNGIDSVGRIFLINYDSLLEKIDSIAKVYSNVIFSDTAGNQVVQFKNKIDKWKVLDAYYKK
ncbi:MAG: DUF4007 family protein [bacterium]